jgi:putrescine transport system substrate-binding protein
MIFEPDIVSRFTDCGVSFLDSPTDVIPMALIYLGFDGNSADLDEIAKAQELLQGVRPYIKYFSSTKLLMDLPNKEICIAMSWSGDYATAYKRAEEAGVKIDLAYTIPEEGSSSWVDATYIPSDAPHPENAHLFLDFLMRPEVIAAISNKTNYANGNRAATPLVHPEIVNNPAIYATDEVLDNSTVQKLFPPKIERIRTRVWSRVKTGI